ncbi:MAG TPA: rhodanese-like domain-containing protein [Methylophilaceae bacterium]|nr:rhodanese-like domain-containing protein [Methylophilaceae bacterium]
MKFVMENIGWIGLLLGSGAMLLWPMLRGSASGVKDVSPAEAVLLINRENAIVLDVREEGEFAAGHIPDAKNIPLSKLAERANELRKFQQKPVVVNCQGGVRSANACGQLKKAGFTTLYNLRGGLGAWNEAKLPVAKG